ncbi:MAG: adenylate/guanylate cyclase domain-containing protein [Hyphomicrobiales bacterium]
MNRLIRAGIDQWPVDEHRRLIVTNIMGYLAALSSLSYAFSYASHDFSSLWPVAIGNVLVALIYLSTPFWHRFGPTAAGLVLAGTIFGSIFFFIWFLGRDSGIQLNYLGTAAVAFAVFGIKRIGLVIASVVIGIGLHLYAHFNFLNSHAAVAPKMWFLDQIYVLTAASLTIVVGIVVWYAFKLAADAEERSERLLRNVLPDAIAERLKANPHEAIAERHESATILFSDIVGFMDLSRSSSPEFIVDLLNKLFTAYDEVGSHLGLEKIKTIGDAYMAAGGVTSTPENYAERVVLLAQGMMKATERIAEETGVSVRLRIGIASGPVMAGVIGQTKFAYDIWGDTVNLAARLESHGAAGRIHICDQTKTLIADAFALERAPSRNIKGVGKATTWFIATEEG